MTARIAMLAARRAANDDPTNSALQRAAQVADDNANSACRALQDWEALNGYDSDDWGSDDDY